MNGQPMVGAHAERKGFVAQHGLWSDEEYAEFMHCRQVIDEQGIDMVRLVFPDPHGLLRGKSLTIDAFEAATISGHGVPSTLLLKDTAQQTVYPVFRWLGGTVPELSGIADIILVPDPHTFRPLPWADATAWVLGDVYFPDGRPATLAPRQVLRDQVTQLADRGYDLMVGLEVEFHVFRQADGRFDPPDSGPAGRAPDVTHLTHSHQLTSELQTDQLHRVVKLIHNSTAALGLPLRSIESEFGGSQLEVTFAPQPALDAADTLVLFRNAVKQICDRNGYHATFMCRPQVDGALANGWHLHQSLTDRRTGNNAFAADSDGAGLSQLALNYLGGLLEHAAASSVFTTPTINGYKRYQPYSLAPDRCVWGLDNRGAMLRVVGQGPAARIENRSAEPAANPYLCLASQIIGGMAGVDTQASPGAPTEDPYDDDAPLLPSTLMEALDALQASATFEKALGTDFIAYVCALKQSELRRFFAAVTDWEQREYFRMY